MWASMDVNGNGYLSLAEVTKVRKPRRGDKVKSTEGLTFDQLLFN